MADQIFVSYRRSGGDVTAKLICEALKNKGYTVFYDFDSLQGGYFDERISKAIENCSDFVLVLPPQALSRCANEGDWLRQEIRWAIKFGKNIIPVMLPGFEFPKLLPDDIASIARINGVQFVMAYFEAVLDAIIARFVSLNRGIQSPSEKDYSMPTVHASENLAFELCYSKKGYVVTAGECDDVHVIIPETYREKPVLEIGERAFEENNIIKSVVIPNSVTHICGNAFADCDRLERITLSENIEVIGGNAIARRMPIGQTAVNILFDGPFSGCSSLLGIVLPKSVRRVGNTSFYGCISLKSIIIPENVFSIGEGAFSDCEALEQITFLTKQLKSIEEDTFSGCSSLKTITIPDTVVSIGAGAFLECLSLKDVAIPKSVISIGSSAFAICESLENITYNGTIEEFKSIQFGEDCFDLEYMPTKVIHCVDGDYPIAELTDLQEDILDESMSAGLSFELDYAESSYYVKRGSCTDSYVVIPRLYKGKPVSQIATIAFEASPFITRVDIPNTVTCISDGAFRECTSLAEITIPKSVTFIGMDNPFLAFAGFGKEPKKIGAFAYCKSLKEIYYQGTIEQWKKIHFGKDCFYEVPTAIIHCSDGDCPIV